MKLDNIQLRLAVRWELGLPLPQLQVALRRGLGCGCCGAAVFDVLGDHVRVLCSITPKEAGRQFGNRL